MAAGKPVQCKSRVERVWPILRHGVGHDPARARCRLEAARSPSAIEVKALDVRFGNDRAGIRRHVHNAGPLAVHAHASKDRKQFTDRLQGVLDHRKTTALTIPQVTVDTRANYQVAFVGLAHIGVDGVGHHHRVQDWFERLGHQRLQRVALQRQANAGHIGQHGAVAGRDDTDLLAGNGATRSLYARDLVAIAPYANHFTVLQNIHAQSIGRACESPGNRVVPRHATTRLERSPQNRVPQRRRGVHDRH